LSQGENPAEGIGSIKLTVARKDVVSSRLRSKRGGSTIPLVKKFGGTEIRKRAQT